MSEPFLVVPGAAPDDPPLSWPELARMSIAAREVVRRALSGDPQAEAEVQEVCNQGVSPRLNSRAYVSAHLMRDAVNEEQWRRARGEVVVQTVQTIESPAPAEPAAKPEEVQAGAKKTRAPAKPRAPKPPAKCEHAANERCRNCVPDSFKRSTA